MYGRSIGDYVLPFAAVCVGIGVALTLLAVYVAPLVWGWLQSLQGAGHEG